MIRSKDDMALNLGKMLYDDLISLGVDERQARAHFRALEFIQNADSKAATRSDLTETSLLLQRDIKKLETDFQLEIKNLEARIQKETEKTRVEIKEVERKITEIVYSTQSKTVLWVAGLMLAQGGMLFGLMSHFRG